MDQWLSLTVSERRTRGKIPPGKKAVHISVPKKVVKLATQRNRIKRLIREVLRKESLESSFSIHTFRVHHLPDHLNLESVREAVHEARSR